MVLLDTGFGTVKVWIECDGRPLTEYMLKATDAITQTCFIASTEGKSFSVCFETDVMKYTSRLSIVMDGVSVGARIVRLGQVSSDKVTGKYVSENSERPFVFGRLQLTEDAGSVNPDKVSSLGTIKCSVDAVVETYIPVQNPFPVVRMPGEDSVNEKVKKAGGHAIRLDEARTVAPLRFVNVTAVTGFPIHRIIFQYAPIDFLYAQEIAPRPPPRALSPEPNQASSSTSSSSARIVKPEPVSPSRLTTKVKAEKGTSSVGGKRPSGSGGVIEISSDEDDAEAEANLSAADKAAYARIKKQIAENRKSRHKKPKLEPTESGESSVTNKIIEISD